jgi:hypothetical protein
VTLLLAAAAGLLFVAGLVVEGAAGAVLLLLVLAALVTLSAARWSDLPSRGRAARLVILAAVAGLVVLKLVK